MKEAQRLIVSAYEQARSSGKPDWNRMTTAVLKNRLLDLTGGTFDETAYGATSFTDFVLRNDDILRLDRSVFPPMVELLEIVQLSQPSIAAIEITGRCRIRPDLWRAALDYSSGARYVWDVVRGSAKPSERPDDQLLISPATLELQSDWRKQFKADVMATLTADESARVDDWIDQNGPISQLPSRLKSRWNGFFCENVRQHLLRWFAESKIPAPSDLSLSATGNASITWSETEALGIRNWALKPHKTVPRPVIDRRSRDVRIHTLNPQQATHLYVRLHRHPVGVIQLHETYVPKIPRPERTLRDYIPLSQFVQYKSFFHTINPNEFDTEQAEETLSAMENWIAVTNDFARESDPRCLPLHVFSAHRTRYDLDTPDGRNQFNRNHGPQKSRADRNGLDWERARDMHGREVLQIRGHQLVRGFHWDVTPGSRTSGSKIVSNTTAIWKIRRHGHVNIYPDAHVRKGQNCRKVYGS